MGCAFARSFAGPIFIAASKQCVSGRGGGFMEPVFRLPWFSTGWLISLPWRMTGDDVLRAGEVGVPGTDCDVRRWAGFGGIVR